MLEGLGGPVQMDKTDRSGIDPTLDMCCQREVSSWTVHCLFDTN